MTAQPRINTPTGAPIGVFDSGIGGVTVLGALARRFPHENFVYLGDTARLPYGAKSPATILRYLEQNLAHLRRLHTKAIVVACNSASTALAVANREDTLPIYEVIEPGAQAALAAAPSGRIAVLGTRATILSGAYERAIMRRRPDAKVWSQACPLLVPLVEEAWEADPITNLIVYRYLQGLLENRPEAIILGCTHYPVLRASIARAAGPEIKLIDAAEAVADAISADIASGVLEAAPAQPLRSLAARVRCQITDASPGFARAAARLMSHSSAESLGALELVDLEAPPLRT